jgi:predicted nucleic acid-binding protein
MSFWTPLKAGAKRICLTLHDRSIQCADAWIAATALAYDISLVTHNGKHFLNVDNLTVIIEPEPSNG